ncbi:MAG: Nif3-like dinuclear metal center hexameric protein [Nanoarchaeota archaeon]|nr:Nif3-like dinuclear metal center hexameric protein [Nanoarchaeota archaeon]MBU1644463.1 Nif3-like dinuclear metal center hexameric protein [Nanoarchaeota archaeon]MBU1976467.1 Nif3-like dinuclear metal center hexameric protein [Nanoarchaeota archaeon]
MTTIKQIAEFLNKELNINNIEDSSCNGLQVENEGEITKIGFAVDACQETFEKAFKAKCNLLVVHHGLIWDSLKHLKGSTYHNIKYLITNNLALYASHLPLDLHEKYGNNVQLANLLQLKDLRAFGFYHDKAIGFSGSTDTTLEKIKKKLQNQGMKTLSLDFGPKEIKKVAIISGGGAKEVYQAVAIGADLYITGEPLHFVHHFAKENNINVIFSGHYETEVWGVKALMPLLQEKFKVKVEFIDVPTIV